MTLSAFRLQRCQWALRGAKALFGKSTSALRRNFNAALPECRSCPCFSAALSRSFPFGKSWRSIPFRRSFSCNRQNKKADTQRHQKSAGALLLLQNDVLCIGFEIQRRDCLFIRSLADSAKKHRVQTAIFSLSISQALGGLRRIRNQNISYSVVVLF